MTAHVAGDADCTVAGGDELLRSRLHRRLIDVRQNHGRARLGEGPRGGEPHASGGTGDERDLAVEVEIIVHSAFLPFPPRALRLERTHVDDEAVRMSLFITRSMALLISSGRMRAISAPLFSVMRVLLPVMIITSLLGM